MKHTEKLEGVVAELNGEYWIGGTGDYCQRFGEIEHADIAEARFCKKPEDMTYKNSPHIELLKKATLRKVTKTTTWEVE